MLFPRWTAANPAKPSTRDNQRLRDTLQVQQLLLTADAPDVVCAWFMGMNPELNDESPAEALADGRAGGDGRSPGFRKCGLNRFSPNPLDAPPRRTLSPPLSFSRINAMDVALDTADNRFDVPAVAEISSAIACLRRGKAPGAAA